MPITAATSSDRGVWHLAKRAAATPPHRDGLGGGPLCVVRHAPVLVRQAKKTHA